MITHRCKGSLKAGVSIRYGKDWSKKNALSAILFINRSARIYLLSIILPPDLLRALYLVKT